MKTLRLLTALVACTAGLFAAEPTVAEAKKFLDNAEKKLFDLSLEANQASWVQSTYITDDTEAVAARANERSIAEAVRLAKGAVRFDKLTLPAGHAAQDATAEDRPGAGGAGESGGKRRGHAAGGVARRNLRQGQVLSGRLRPARPSRAWISKPSRA